MPRDFLPPNGIMVPSTLLYDKTLQPVVRDTWARLRGFAWGRSETPELNMDQICDLLEMKRSTLYGHLSILKARAALQWRAVGNSTIIISFAEAADPQSRFLDSVSGHPGPQSRNLDSQPPEKPIKKVIAGAVGQSRNLDKPSLSVLPTEKLKEREGAVQKSGRKAQPKEPRPAAIDAFRAVSKRFPDEATWPNIVQIVGSESRNLDRWQETIRGWIAAGYRKENVAGILDWFKQGRTSKAVPPGLEARPTSNFKDYN